MSGSHRERAVSRATNYRMQIAKAQAAQDYERGTNLSLDWLKGELAKVRRTRPEDAAAVDAALTEKVSELAEAVPFFKPARKG